MPGEVSLRVAGKPSGDDLAASLRRLADQDPRIDLTLDFLSDAELVGVASSSELVVLPYTHMHNSGGVLASLSLDTPVLVPRNEANEALATEVGPGWVLQYDGELDGHDLVEALAALPRRQDHPGPTCPAEAGIRPAPTTSRPTGRP